LWRVLTKRSAERFLLEKMQKPLDAQSIVWHP
jgi:hypothetical protein